MRYLILGILATCTAMAAPTYLSPDIMQVSKDGKRLYVVAATGGCIVSFDLKSKATKKFALPQNPTGVAISPDGKTLYVTAGVVKGELIALNPSDGKILYTVSVGHSPTSPVCSADGSTIYVANRYASKISRVDLKTRKTTGSIAVTREPVSMVRTKTRLFVANHLPYGRADGERIGSVLDVIDLATFTRRKPVQLVNGSYSLRTISLSIDEKWVYVPSYVGRFSVPTTQLERGWMNTSALNIVNVEKEHLEHSVLLDDVDLGGANPWQIACTADNKYVCVSHSATNEVSVIDRAGLFKRIKKIKPAHQYKSVAAYEAAPGVPVNRLDSMVDVRRRIDVKAYGPRGMVAVGNTLYTANYFSDSLTKIDVGATLKASPIALGPKQELTIVREGEMYFHDATNCFQHWQTCSTCHPSGRSDSLNWDLLNDGIGNPKNTKSLVYSHITPPVMISGIRPNAETAVRAGMKYIMFTVPTEKKAKAMDAYLRSLKPVPSPFLVNGKLSESAKRGKDVFSSAGCIMCHSGQLFTDKKMYNVGTGMGVDAKKKFDTPQLVEIWRTAPYLLDGRAATLTDVFTKHNKNDVHGSTSTLTKKELQDLIDYLKSL